MANEAEMKAAIQAVIKGMMDGVMDRALSIDPFLPDAHRAERPLYAALVPDEIFKGSHFERKFVTSFGSAWEKLTVVAATHGLGYGAKGITIEGNVGTERLRRIQEVLNNLEHTAKGKAKVRPDWDTEIAYVLAGGGDPIPVTVVVDVYAMNTKTNETFSFELKAPLPNSDQTKVSKEKLLKLYSMEPLQVDGAYYALLYNPYGKREDYAWPHPARWFNMKKDKVVLIGNELWEKIGGVGTYQAFITAVNEIGKEYREQIYREYLGIEPPPDSDFIL